MGLFKRKNKGSAALVWISKRTKQIKKDYPAMKHRSAQKHASEEYREKKNKGGSVGRVKKRKPVRRKAATKKRRKAVRRKPVRRARKKSVGVVVRRRRSVAVGQHRKRRSKPRKVSGSGRRRRSGGGGISTTKVLMLAGLAAGAYFLLKPKTPALPPGAPPLVNTTNPVRNNQANNIVNYAIAGGLAIDAIIRLINSLNTKPDSEIQGVYDNINSGGGIPRDYIA